MVYHFVIREAMRTRNSLEAEVSTNEVDAENIVKGLTGPAVTLDENEAPAEIEIRKTRVEVNKLSGTTGGLARQQGSTTIASVTQTMNRFNLDGLRESPRLQVATATLYLAVLGNLQVLVENHDTGAITEVTLAEAMAAVEEDRAMNGVVAVEADQCVVGPEKDREMDPEMDQDGWVMTDETQEVTSEAQAGSGGVTFQKCRQTTETSDLDVRSVPYTVCRGRFEEMGHLREHDTTVYS